MWMRCELCMAWQMLDAGMCHLPAEMWVQRSTCLALSWYYKHRRMHACTHLDDTCCAPGLKHTVSSWRWPIADRITRQSVTHLIWKQNNSKFNTQCPQTRVSTHVGVIPPSTLPELLEENEALLQSSLHMKPTKKLVSIPVTLKAHFPHVQIKTEFRKPERSACSELSGNLTCFLWCCSVAVKRHQDQGNLESTAFNEGLSYSFRGRVSGDHGGNPGSRQTWCCSCNWEPPSGPQAQGRGRATLGRVWSFETLKFNRIDSPFPTMSQPNPSYWEPNIQTYEPLGTIPIQSNTFILHYFF